MLGQSHQILRAAALRIERCIDAIVCLTNSHTSQINDLSERFPLFSFVYFTEIDVLRKNMTLKYTSNNYISGT